MRMTDIAVAKALPEQLYHASGLARNREADFNVCGGTPRGRPQICAFVDPGNQSCASIARDNAS